MIGVQKRSAAKKVPGPETRLQQNDRPLVYAHGIHVGRLQLSEI
jgi:hypothetical protein